MPRKTTNRTVLASHTPTATANTPMPSAAARMMSRERHPEDCGGSGARRSCCATLPWAVSPLAAFDPPGLARSLGWSVIAPAGMGMTRQRLLARSVDQLEIARERPVCKDETGLAFRPCGPASSTFPIPPAIPSPSRRNSARGEERRPPARRSRTPGTRAPLPRQCSRTGSQTSALRSPRSCPECRAR